MRNFQVPGTIDTLAEARAFYSDLHFVYWYARPTKFLAGPGGQSTWYLRQASEELMALLVKEVREEHQKRTAA